MDNRDVVRDVLLNLAARFESGELRTRSIWPALHGGAAQIAERTGEPYGRGISLVFRAVARAAEVDVDRMEYVLGDILRSRYSDPRAMANLLREASNHSQG